MYQLRPYQTESCHAAWHWLNTNPGNCVISLPTGAGKSLVIADLCRQAIEWGGRVLVVAHRRELLTQNGEKIHKLIPDVSLGIYSAGLNFRHTSHDVICCGIQSVHKRAAEFGARHLALIDESHLVPSRDDGMYRTFLSDLRAINPELRVVGLTATPYRTGEGSLCGPDRIFQGIAYNADVRALIEAGYLCPITNTPADNEADTSKLHVRAGEFIQREVESLFGDDYLIRRSVAEIVAKTRGRHSVLIFCSGVAHAEKVAEEIERQSGQVCGVVTGDTPPLERSATLESFRSQRLHFLCNVDVLTTGFDAPCIDAIAILRATDSAGLFAQIVGRGLRPHESKTDVLLLDFGQNLQRHGPIDDIDFGKPKKKGDGSDSDAAFKLCPNCEEKVAPSVRECVCGFRFPPPPIKHDENADTQTAVLSVPVVPVLWTVEEVNLHRHKKRGDGPNTLRVDYTCNQGGNLKETISEWVCVEHVDPFPLKKARQWWKEHTNAPWAGCIDETISLFTRGAFRMPTTITTVKEGRWNRITARTFEDDIPEAWAEEAFVAPWEGTVEEPF